MIIDGREANNRKRRHPIRRERKESAVTITMYRTPINTATKAGSLDKDRDGKYIQLEPCKYGLHQDANGKHKLVVTKPAIFKEKSLPYNVRFKL